MKKEAENFFHSFLDKKVLLFVRIRVYFQKAGRIFFLEINKKKNGGSRSVGNSFFLSF